MKSALADKHIVIIEDDYNLRYILKTYFQGKARVSAYETAEACLASELEYKDADVFIIDYLLPSMNGIELFKALKAKQPNVKTILMTGNLSPEIAEEGMHLGFDSLILKPFDFTILEKNIIELLGIAPA